MSNEIQELDVVVEAIGEDADIDALYEKYKKHTKKETAAKAEMKHDEMKHDEMKHDEMKHDEMKHDDKKEAKHGDKKHEVNTGRFPKKEMKKNHKDEDIEVELDDEDELEEAKEPIEEPEQDDQPLVEPVPHTKAGMINAMYKKLNSMTKKEVGELYAEMEGGESEKDFEDKSQAELEESFEKLFEESQLDESFRAEIESLFESRVNVRVEERVQELEQNFSESIKETEEELIEKVDKYLDFVVENWMEENKVGVENTVRTEIAESFMEELKALFENHYIDIPESKVDVVEQLSQKIESLEEELNSNIEQSIALKEKLANSERDTILSEQLSSLSRLDAEKVRKLASKIIFEDKQSFVKEIDSIKRFLNEQYSNQDFEDEIVSLDEVSKIKETNPRMQRYVESIAKSVQ